MMSLAPVTPILGSASRDLVFLEARIEEWYKVYAKSYPYWGLKPAGEQSQTRNVYGEIDYDGSPKRPDYDEAKVVRLWVRLDPPQKTLDRFGLDSPQQALVTGSALAFRNVAIRPRTGDRFDFNEWQYEVTTVKEGGWFSNSGAAVEWVMTATRVNKRWPLQT